jgi:hypothetical protein
MVNVSPSDIPPPGAGLKTTTVAVPSVAIFAAVIDAVNCVALTKLVVMSVLFHLTTEPETKFEPSTVRVNSELPARAFAGEREDSMGTGLLIANVTSFDVPPPGVGLKTVTVAAPTDSILQAEIDTVNCVLLT